MQTESFLTGKSEFGLMKTRLWSMETQKHGKWPKTATFAHYKKCEYLLHSAHCLKI